MMTTAKSLEYKYYRSRPDWKNGTAEFHDMITQLLKSRRGDVLELGPGPSNPTSRKLASFARRLDGLDIDERACTNDALNEAFIYSGNEFPMEAGRYDVIVADYVMEHVEHPGIMMREVARVLRPGGAFAFRTPNSLHYVTLISRFTPHALHLLTANPARQRGKDAVDPYPTFYRFNSLSTVRRHAHSSSLIITELRLVEKEPSYLRFSRLAFRAGVLYERMVNASSLLAGMRANIFGVLHKPM